MLQVKAVEVVDTPERFAAMKETVAGPLLELLGKLCELEEEVFERNQALEKEKEKAGLAATQMAEGFWELTEEFEERYKALVEDRCTEKLLDRGYAMSFGCPARYAYVKTGCKMTFTMKTAKKAVVEASFNMGVDKKHQFVLNDTADGWRIAQVNSAYTDENWQADRI